MHKKSTKYIIMMIILNGKKKTEQLEDKQGTQHHTESLFLQLDIK